ncbi:MAG: LOG family protein [Calditrichaeota bacterium]|nr:MAG: LOG family protein [Calditrichota bacterium]MBL1204254.1 LOG family protein [Calditrichota bacterium]NOG44084.1 LOG family protein [Calditrichota bacterium]
MTTPHKPDKAYKNNEFLNSKNARPLRIQAEYFEPFYRFRKHNIKATIVFFGSARILSKEEAVEKVDAAEKLHFKHVNDKNKAALIQAQNDLKMSQYYEDAVELSKRITEWTLDEATKKQKYFVCSGGGPGIMEAANKGAVLANGRSVGLNVSLPMEQYPNPFITKELSFEFHYFFMRKYWFVYFAKAIVIFPGGFGTLDELMEALTLIQTKKVNKKMPIIIFGKDYWTDVLNLDALVKWGTISEEDLQLFNFVDTVEEAMNILEDRLPR